jgi:predicted O-methyltransferase YrrM
VPPPTPDLERTVTDPTPPVGVDPDLLRALAAAQVLDTTLDETELADAEGGHPVTDRAAGAYVAFVVRAVGARDVVELDAGRGGMTWWLAGAVGDGGRVTAFTTPTDAPALETRLRRAGRFDRVHVHAVADPGDPCHLGDPGHLDADLDAIVARAGTAAVRGSWEDLVARVRAGGVVLVGDVVVDGPTTGPSGATVREALEDPEVWATLVPIGGGWLSALKGRSDLAGGVTDRLW